MDSSESVYSALFMSLKSAKRPKVSRQCIRKLWFNILAVDKGIKPCYLWDACAVTIEEVQNFVCDLQEMGVTSHVLDLVVVRGVIFVTLVDSLKCHLKKMVTEDSALLVDVSEYRRIPVLLSKSESAKILKNKLGLVSILDQLLNLDTVTSRDLPRRPTVIELLCSDSCNMTTVFGAFLGYPVIYWYGSKKDFDIYEASNCLSMIPLRVYRIQAGGVNDKIQTHCDMPSSYEAYSFSIPECLVPQTERCIQAWFESIGFRYTSQTNDVFSNLQLVHRVAVLPAVAL